MSAPYSVGVKTIVTSAVGYDYNRGGWRRVIRVMQYLLRPTKGFRKSGPTKIVEQFHPGHRLPFRWKNEIRSSLQMERRRR